MTHTDRLDELNRFNPKVPGSRPGRPTMNRQVSSIAALPTTLAILFVVGGAYVFVANRANPPGTRLRVRQLLASPRVLLLPLRRPWVWLCWVLGVPDLMAFAVVLPLRNGRML